MSEFHAPVPAQELSSRLSALRDRLSATDPQWRMALINNKINLYYLTGTMQEGVLAITPDEAVFWVRRSYERALRESKFPDIRPMKSYRVLEGHFGQPPETVYLEVKTSTLEWLDRVRKYFPFAKHRALIPLLQDIRARKSEYELSCMRRAGQMHADVLQRIAPTLLREGVSEAEFCGEVFLAFLRQGSMGICRYNQPIGEDVAGFCGFGENSLAQLAFDGPDGCAGTCLAVQAIGDPCRKLKHGDLVLMDMPAGFCGYHTDKTVVWHFGSLAENPNGALIREAYDVCVDIERAAAHMLRPGAIAEEIYLKALKMVPAKFQAGFMNGCKFLGHSIGLVMDETPVIAPRFTDPLEAGMALALEPKIALPGVGLVGTENTYEVTAAGGVSLTGAPQPLQEIG